jgi:hypothetical protein
MPGGATTQHGFGMRLQQECDSLFHRVALLLEPQEKNLPRRSKTTLEGKRAAIERGSGVIPGT